MPYTLERLPDAPIILYVQLPGGGILDEQAELMAASRKLLDAEKEPVFIVNDLRNLKITLDEMLRSASNSARGEKALLHHPMIRENIYIITDPTIRMAITGLTSATFGRVRLTCFDAVEQAMEYCQAQIADGNNGAK